MRNQARLRRLEAALAREDRLRGERTAHLWEPEDPDSTAFVAEQLLRTPHPQRRYEIHIAGEPKPGVYKELSARLLPDRDTVQKMTDEELQACQEQYLAASIAALNASRRRQGLPPVFERSQTAAPE